MNKFLYIVFLTCFSILCLNFSLYGQTIGNHPITNYTTSDYKAGNQNIDFAQNENRTVFIANNLGVLERSGLNWTLHSIEGAKIRSLLYDDIFERLYVGSQGKFGYVDKEWNYTSLSDEIDVPFDDIWDIYEINGDVYFCSFNGIFQYDGKTIQSILPNTQFKRSFKVGNKLFTETQHGDVIAISNGEHYIVVPKNSQSSNIVNMFQYNTGFLIFYNSGEIFEFSESNFSAKYSNLQKVVKQSYVNDVKQVNESQYFIATQNQGVIFFDSKKNIIEQINPRAGLLSNSTLSIFQDANGNLWTGLQNGISVISIHSPMHLLHFGIDGSGYAAIEHGENTYFSTSNGLFVKHITDENANRINYVEGPGYEFLKLKNSLYVCHHSGLYQLKNNSIQQVVELNGLWKIIQLQHHPGYAIGGLYNGLYLFKVTLNGDLIPIQPIDGFSESSRFLEEDDTGEIWVSQYNKGVYKLQIDFEKRLVTDVQNLSDFLPSKTNTILSKMNGDILFGTIDGIYKLQENRIVKATEFSEFSGQQINLLIPNQNDLHVISNEQTGIYKRFGGRYIYTQSSLNQLKYNINNDLMQGTSFNEKGILISANEGFIQYFETDELKFHVNDDFIVTNVKDIANNKSLYQYNSLQQANSTIQQIKLNHQSNAFQFTVDNFNYNTWHSPQFRYKLKGLEHDFSEWTTSSVKEYTSLKDGEYTFVAQTKNVRGELISSVPIQLTINPPFHKSVVGRALLTILVFTGLYFLLQFANKNTTRKVQKIEQKKNVAIAEKQKEIEFIQESSEKKIVELEEEKLQNELQHLNNLLAASTMNLVVKNELIETIKVEVKNVKKKAKDKLTERALDKIVKDINTGLRLNEDWQQFEYHFDKVHGDFLNRLRTTYPELTSQDQKLSAYLRLNLVTKEIAQLMNISVRGVEIARYRLRKRLGLKTGENLSKFILKF